MNRTFSLQALVLAACFAAAALAIYRNRQPWALVSTKSDKSIQWPERGCWKSPDKTREIRPCDDCSRCYVCAPGLQSALEPSNIEYGPPTDVNFVDDDTIQVLSSDPESDFRAIVRTYKRRFPEWWWGHFYRPEVWAALIIAALWTWRVTKWIVWRRRAVTQ